MQAMNEAPLKWDANDYVPDLAAGFHEGGRAGRVRSGWGERLLRSVVGRTERLSGARSERGER